MVTANIAIDQVGVHGGIPGQSRDDLSLGVTVELTNGDDTDVESWNWRLLAKPLGSAAHIVNPTESRSSFVPDVAGSYLIRLLVNGRVQDTVIAAVKTASLGLRIPAKGEVAELDGWETALQKIIGQLELGIISNRTNSDRYLVFSDDTQFAETGTTFVTKKTFRIVRDPNHLPVQWRVAVSLWVIAPGAVAECRVQAVGTGGTDSITLAQVSSTSETMVYGTIPIVDADEPSGDLVSIDIQLRNVSGAGTVYLQYTDVFALQS